MIKFFLPFIIYIVLIFVFMFIFGLRWTRLYGKVDREFVTLFAICWPITLITFLAMFISNWIFKKIDEITDNKNKIK